MFGFLIGTVCLVGFMRMLRRSYGYGGWGGGPWGYGRTCGGHGGWHGGPYRARRGWYSDGAFDDDGEDFEPWRRRGGGPEGMFFGLRSILDRLETTPGQEKAIRAAFDELRGKGRAVKEDARGMRRDLAAAFRGESIDAETLGTIASRTSGAIDSARDAAIGAVLKIHDALDERQRAIVADLLESGLGFGRWRGRGGPYRAARG